jgi:hypothetical protein
VLSDWTKVQPYKINRASGSFTLRKNPIGMTDIVAMDFNPLLTKSIEPLALLRCVKIP